MIDLSGASIVDSGGSAVVFRFGDRALKVFHAPDHTDSPLKDFRIECIRAVFQSELDAWTLVQRSSYLRRHTPAFHGACVVGGLAPSRFLLDCCYVMDFVPGAASKVENWDPLHLARAVDEFAHVGIAHHIDASCFAVDDIDAFKLIDFSVRDVYGQDARCIDD